MNHTVFTLVLLAASAAVPLTHLPPTGDLRRADLEVLKISSEVGAPPAPSGGFSLERRAGRGAFAPSDGAPSRRTPRASPSQSDDEDTLGPREPSGQSLQDDQQGSPRKRRRGRKSRPKDPTLDPTTLGADTKVFREPKPSATPPKKADQASDNLKNFRHTMNVIKTLLKSISTFDNKP